MTEATAATPVARRGPDPVVVTGAGALSAYGLGTEALLSGVLCGRPAFGPVTGSTSATAGSGSPRPCQDLLI